MNKMRKQFRITVYESSLLITTPGNNVDAYVKEIPKNRRVMISNGWIETNPGALSYYECRGVLILFGVNPPSFEDLCNQLKIKTTTRF